MIIKSLSVYGLRNLEPTEISFSDRINLLLGKNGQGKTSILEAIFLISHAKSFRTQTLKHVLRNDYEKKEGAVKVVLENYLGTLSLEIRILGSKRELFINDKRISGADNFIGNLKTVLFTPDDLEVVKGAPIIRRQFIDRTLVMVDKRYTKLLLDYSKIIKMRNSLLKNEDFREADLFINNLTELNYEITIKRADLINKIGPFIKQSYEQISENKEETLELNYKSDFIKKDLTHNNIKDELVYNTERDRINKRTTIGCHRDDVLIKFKSETANGNSRDLSSQGQARTIALSFKLGAFYFIKNESNESPVLLFDDFEGELDERRSSAFYKAIKETKAQIFLTTTHKRSHTGTEITLKELVRGRVI